MPPAAAACNIAIHCSALGATWPRSTTISVSTSTPSCRCTVSSSSGCRSRDNTECANLRADEVIEKRCVPRSASRRAVMADKGDPVIGHAINVIGMVGVLAGLVLFTFGIVLLVFRHGFGFDLFHWFW